MDFDLITANIARHINLDEAELSLFTAALRPRVVLKKEYLIRNGDICRHDYFVNSGCFKVCYTDDKGIENIVKFAIEDWWVVDLDSFLHSKPSFYYIQAIEDSEVFAISKTEYDWLHEQIPSFHKFSSERWQNGFIALQQRIMQNLSLTAEERYAHFTKKYPTLQQRIPQKLIAAYLGITPEFLSMLRKKWATSFS